MNYVSKMGVGLIQGMWLNSLGVNYKEIDILKKC